MRELVRSVMEKIDERLTSPVYGTFLLWWCIFHWRFIIVIFFESEDKIWASSGLLKGDYLKQEFFNFRNPEFYLFFLLPVIFTWLAISKFPKYIFIPAFKIQENDEKEKKLFRLNNEIEIAERNKKKIESISEEVAKEQRLQALDPTLQWDKDYEHFKSIYEYRSFNIISDIIYGNNGFLGHIISDRKIQRLIAYCHSDNQIKWSGDNRIELTEKGKYFIKKFSSER